jgi:type I restriction enzyme, S subunit
MRVRISRISEVKGGKRLPKGEELVSLPTPHPYIRAQDIHGGMISICDPKFLTAEQHQRLRRYIVETEDVCIVIVGANVGDVGIVPEHLNGANLTENAVRLTSLSPDCVPRYVNYCLSTPDIQAQMRQVAAGAAQPKLGIYKIRDLEIPFPPRKTQERIASILSAYDDLIENNTRRIKILEEMAQMLYRERFVKFRFPGHENAKMVESELGPIPEGWTAMKLGDVLTLEYGKALRSSDRVDGPVPVYGSSGLVGHHSRGLTQGPGIIVGRKGNVGSVFLCHSDFWVIDTAYYVRSELSLRFLYFNLMAQNFLNNDAAVPGLNRNQAHSLPLVVPDSEALSSFDEIVSPMFDLKRSLETRSANLRATRDFLLPKLISGEVPVEAAGEAAAELVELTA